MKIKRKHLQRWTKKMVQTDTSTSTTVSLVETYISACLFSINRSGKCSKYFRFKTILRNYFSCKRTQIYREISQFRRPLSQCFAHSEQIFDRCRWLMSFFILINWFIARCRSSVWLRLNMFYDGKYWDKYVKWNSVEREIIMLYEDKLQSMGENGHASFGGRWTWNGAFQISD